MVFQLSREPGSYVGRYFDLKGDQIVRSEHVVMVDGGWEIKTGSGLRYFDNDKDAAMKTLLQSPYYAMVSYQLDTIVAVPPRGQCFEQPGEH